MRRALIWIIFAACAPPVGAQVTEVNGALTYLQPPPVPALVQNSASADPRSASNLPFTSTIENGQFPPLTFPVPQQIQQQSQPPQPQPPSPPVMPIATHAFPAVQRIASTIPADARYTDAHVVRYDVPVADLQTLGEFAAVGIHGKLIEVPVDHKDANGRPATVQLVRYDVPEDEIMLHSRLSREGLRGDLIQVDDPDAWKPQVRFLQPKARVFFDLKRNNDAQFDLFRNGSLLASLDVLEIYKPLKFVQDYFAEEEGKAARLHNLGWRVGATFGLGITTALGIGGESTGAPIGVASLGLRYEFPIGPEPPMILDQSGRRVYLDQRTRVGFEMGVQGGTTADERIADRFDAGFYVGMLVNTPW